MATPTTWGAWLESDLSGNTDIDGLIYGTQWAGHTVTFSFPTAGSLWSADENSGYGAQSGAGEPWNGFGALSTTDRSATRTALQSWSNVANLSFREVSDNESVVGDLRFAYATLDAAQAQAYFPTESVKGGDVWFDRNGTSFTEEWTLGSYEYMTTVHEIGHAIGLKHPFEGSGYNNTVAGAAWDTRSFTVMSYSAKVGDTNTYFSFEPTTPMVLDILAIQQLYGENTSYNATDTTYTYSGTGDYHRTLWDAGGTDTIVYSASTGGTIDLREGYGSQLGNTVRMLDQFSTNLGAVLNVWVAYGAVIENATGGSGDDDITGNDVANVLNGGLGADTLAGGKGNDLYRVDNTGDVVTEASGGGNDLVYSSLASYTLTGNVERLRIDVASTANGTGNTLDNTFYAAAGNNRLDGSTGTDTVSYAYATAGVIVSLATTSAQATGGSGSDTLRSIENLTGSTHGDALTGNAAANRLDGGSGSDTLDGGAGIDTLVGGAGSDRYYVDSASDLVAEVTVSVTTGGSDVVYSRGTAYTLGANVEHLRILATGTSRGTGNTLANTLWAGAGNNVMTGGSGSDTVSYAYAGAAVAVSLSSTAAQATGGSGSDTLSGFEFLTGSAYSDRLSGNSAANRLSGGAGNDRLTGGSGADTLTGGSGNDDFRFIARTDGGDTISDFAAGQDRIAVVAANFGLVAGSTARVRVDAGPTTAAGTFLYTSSTGVLRFDADGTGAGAAVTLATLTTRPATLTSANFSIGT